MQLERGKLYQVKHGNSWIIAEYVVRVEAHRAHGRNLKGQTEWHEPVAHLWKDVRGLSHFHIRDKGMQTRPVTDETLAEIERLRGEIKQIGEDLRAKTKELRTLCE
jgi:hypothetical protein